MPHHAMRPTLRGAAVAAALLAFGGAAGAMPVTSAAPAVPSAAIERTANGCGPGYFRTLAGECFPNRRVVGPFGGVRAPPPCPPGYLRSPDRPLCYPVRR